jgi:hypothetical protein
MPCPLSARSRLESVNSTLPCANCCVTAATRTPLPLALFEVPCSDTANRSANSVREPLKPLVSVLAMLFAVTLRLAWEALRPESAIRNGMWLSPVWFCQSTRSTSPISISPSESVSSLRLPVAGSSATLETCAATLVDRETFSLPTRATTSIR